jgi:hypothetical protein
MELLSTIPDANVAHPLERQAVIDCATVARIASQDPPARRAAVVAEPFRLWAVGPGLIAPDANRRLPLDFDHRCKPEHGPRRRDPADVQRRAVAEPLVAVEFGPYGPLYDLTVFSERIDGAGRNGYCDYELSPCRRTRICDSSVLLSQWVVKLAAVQRKSTVIESKNRQFP